MTAFATIGCLLATLAISPGSVDASAQMPELPSAFAGDSETTEAGSRAAGQSELRVDSVAARGDSRSEALVASDAERTSLETSEVEGAFEAFIEKHGRVYQRGTAEYTLRKALFKQRLTAVHAHNARPTRNWKAAPSRFSDFTDAERAAMRGLRHRLARPSGPASVLGLNASRKTPQAKLPPSKSWTHLGIANHIRDQGSCGSCWAIATVSVFEAHYEIYSMAKGSSPRRFSAQQVVDCSPNPEQCGGTGGCQGATVEIGLNWILEKGIAQEKEVPYLGQDGTSPCLDAQVLNGQSSAGSIHGGAALGLRSFKTLERNVDYPLAEALVNYGPVAVSASAGSWFEYSSGIFDSCDKDTVVDHAITAWGYGEAKGIKYWHLRNSWGSDWGENGFMRLLRHGDGQTHCGTDNDPASGVGCKGGPASVTICGMCGILYDSVVPYMQGSPAFPSGSAPASHLDVTDVSSRDDRTLTDEVVARPFLRTESVAPASVNIGADAVPTMARREKHRRPSERIIGF